MDLYLIENCPHIVERVTGGLEAMGKRDFESDPIYCVFGAFGAGMVSFYHAHKSEFDKALDFIDDWWCDIHQFNLEKVEDIVSLVFQCLACEVEEEVMV